MESTNASRQLLHAIFARAVIGTAGLLSNSGYRLDEPKGTQGSARGLSQATLEMLCRTMLGGGQTGSSMASWAILAKEIWILISLSVQKNQRDCLWLFGGGVQVIRGDGPAGCHSLGQCTSSCSVAAVGFCHQNGRSDRANHMGPWHSVTAARAVGRVNMADFDCLLDGSRAGQQGGSIVLGIDLGSFKRVTAWMVPVVSMLLTI
ncbi:uncharacterized protein BKA78DRAFT_18278 [Phyllosticta capitalensis]|uniref:uncharacterized protein n=1 Tax=Phyllosticta capitalensis TaxID=121624 RepID=UPI00312FFD81